MEVVSCAKILGLIVTDDLKWNEQVSQVVKKARKRLYFLSQLKRSNIGTNELVQFYVTCIRPIMEYASPVFHDSLTSYLANDIESVQKRAMRIIFPWTPYDDALTCAGLKTLSTRRGELTEKLFKDVVTNKNHKLHGFLPPLSNINISLRSKRKYDVSFYTQRYKNSFITYNALRT